MKIYLVSSGDYSDYCVRGVYSTKAKARTAKKLFASMNDIQTMELDETPTRPDGTFLFTVIMDRNGNVSKAKIRDANALPYVKEWLPAPDDTVWFSMWARDSAHAIKVASERRTMLIANNLWPTRQEADPLRLETK